MVRAGRMSGGRELLRRHGQQSARRAIERNEAAVARTHLSPKRRCSQSLVSHFGHYERLASTSRTMSSIRQRLPRTLHRVGTFTSQPDLILHTTRLAVAFSH